MRIVTPAIVVCSTASLVMLGAAVGIMAHADPVAPALHGSVLRIPETPKAPPPPVVRRERGLVIAHGGHERASLVVISGGYTGLAGTP